MGLSTAHDVPSGEAILHHAWPFLIDNSCARVCSVSLAMQAYARLRLFASAQSQDGWTNIRTMGPISVVARNIAAPCTYCLAFLLLLFDFDIGDLV